jgi:predicted RecA/RadA family phage recombinase
MAKASFVQEGNRLDYRPSGATTAGTVVVSGNLVGIATTDIAANALGAISTVGIFDVAHAADAITAGAAVYWDADGNPVGGTAGTGAATATSSNNTFMGWALAAVDETDTTVRVKLFGSPAVTVNHYGPLNNLIADPGTGKAIPVTASGRVEIVTGATGQTNTLEAPTFGGQQLLLGLKTDGGGDRVVTVTGCEDGNTITFADAGQAVLLCAVAKGTAFVWRVVSDPDEIVSTT